MGGNAMKKNTCLRCLEGGQKVKMTRSCATFNIFEFFMSFPWGEDILPALLHVRGVNCLERIFLNTLASDRRDQTDTEKENPQHRRTTQVGFNLAPRYYLKALLGPSPRERHSGRTPPSMWLNAQCVPDTLVCLRGSLSRF